MAKFSSILLTLLLVVIAAYSAQSQPQRHKRDLKFIKNLLYNTLFGKDSNPASPELPPLVIRRSPGKYRVIGVPEGYKSLYIKRYPQDVIIKETKPFAADSLGIIESYLGTKTQQESLSALQDVNKLIQSGIITIDKEPQTQVKDETIQAQDVQYEVPASIGVIEDSYSYELHVPSDDQPKVFSRIIEVPEPKAGSSGSGEGRTSYEVPLSIVQGLQKSEQPVVSISSERKEDPAKIATSPVIVQNVEHLIKIPKLETVQSIETIPVEPISSSNESGFYYTQFQPDGSVAYYRNDGTAVQTFPRIATNSGDLIPKIPMYILERMQKMSAQTPVNRNYSYKLVKNVDANGKLYLSRLSDKAIVNDVYAKGYTVIDNGYFTNANKATYNIPSKYSYKQISLDGNTLYYNDNSKNNVANPLKSSPREFLFQRMKNLADNVDSRKYNADGTFDKGALLFKEPFTSRYIYNSVPVNSETYSKERLQNTREDYILNNKYNNPSGYYYRLVNPDGAILYYNGNNVVDSHYNELKKEQKTPLTNFPTYSYEHVNNLSTQTQEPSQTSNPYLSRVEVRVNETHLKNGQKHPSEPFFYSYSQTGGKYLSKQSNDVVVNQEKGTSHEDVNQSVVPNTDNNNFNPKSNTQSIARDGQYSYLQVNTDGSQSTFENEEKLNSNKKYSGIIDKDEPKRLTLYAPGQYSYVQTHATGETSNFDAERVTTSNELYVDSALPNERQSNFKVTTDSFPAKPSEAAIEYSSNTQKGGHSLSIQQHNNHFSYIRTKSEGTNSVKIGLSTVSTTPSTNSPQSSYSYKLVESTKIEESDQEDHKHNGVTTNSNFLNDTNDIKDTERIIGHLKTTSQNPLSLEANPIVVLPIDHSYSYRSSNVDGSNVDVQRVDDKVFVDIRFGQHDDKDEYRGDV